MPHKSVLLQVQKAVQVQVDTNVRREKRQKLPALSILLLFLFKWISLHKKSEKPIFLLRALCKIKIPMPIRMQSPPPHLPVYLWNVMVGGAIVVTLLSEI